MISIGLVKSVEPKAQPQTKWLFSSLHPSFLLLGLAILSIIRLMIRLAAFLHLMNMTRVELLVKLIVGIDLDHLIRV